MKTLRVNTKPIKKGQILYMWKIEGLNDWKKFDIITDESTIPQFKKKQKYTKIVVKNNIKGIITIKV